MANIKDRHSIPTQLAAAEQHLRLALNERSELAYTQALDPTAEGTAQLQALETEIADHRLRIERLNLAAEVAARVGTERDVEAERAAQADRIKRLGELHDEINQASKELVKVLAALHRPLAQLQAATRERGSVAWAACSSPFVSGNEAHRRVGVRFARLTSGSSESSMLLAALAQSGLGRMGPSLEPFCKFELPRVDAPGEALQRMVDVQASLVELIAEAEAAANAPPPTDDDPEYPETETEETTA
jgi:hypothetical protein